MRSPQKKDSLWPTSITQIAQSLFVPLEVIVDLELLVIRLQRPQLPKERQILSRVLEPTVSFLMPLLGVESVHLLRVLSDHQHERKVIHPQREIEQCVSVYEEDDVFHSIFN